MEHVVKEVIYLMDNVSHLILIVVYKCVKKYKLPMRKKFVWKLVKVIIGELNLVNNPILVHNIILLAIIVVSYLKCGLLICVLQFLQFWHNP